MFQVACDIQRLVRQSSSSTPARRMQSMVIAVSGRVAARDIVPPHHNITGVTSAV